MATNMQGSSVAVEGDVEKSITQVEFYLSATNLPNLDTFSNTDPFAVVYLDETQGKIRNWREVNRTETIDDTQNPKWTKQFHVNYKFETMQYLKFELYDRDSKSELLKKHDYIGSCFTTMGALMGSKGQALNLRLVPKSGAKFVGYMQIRAEEICACPDLMNLRLSAKKLDNKDGFFGKSDPFFTISRSREDGTYFRVFKSDHIDNNLNPKWKDYNISVQKLCNGDYSRPLLLEVYDYESSGKHQIIGSFQTDINRLQDHNVSGKSFFCINADKKAKSKKYINSGEVFVDYIKIIRRHTMLEYLRGGLEISFIACIDYTASNGAVTEPGSLHYLNPDPNVNHPNAYQQAIETIGQIVQEYDHDKKFPVYGFGGIIAGTNQVNHCFPLTFDADNPEVEGVKGILDVYTNSLQSVRLHGPTCFAPIINAAAELARRSKQEQGSNTYIVMLIITDGVIMDMDATKDAIVRASDLPLSIIIVGVGSANFDAMEALDGDDGLLKGSDGTACKRDIVQFVPMRKYHGPQNLARLARETLIEVPTQLETYMAWNDIVPAPPPAFVPITAIPTDEASVAPLPSAPEYV